MPRRVCATAVLVADRPITPSIGRLLAVLLVPVKAGRGEYLGTLLAAGKRGAEVGEKADRMWTRPKGVASLCLKSMSLAIATGTRWDQREDTWAWRSLARCASTAWHRSEA